MVAIPLPVVNATKDVVPEESVTDPIDVPPCMVRAAGELTPLARESVSDAICVSVPEL